MNIFSDLKPLSRSPFNSRRNDHSWMVEEYPHLWETTATVMILIPADSTVLTSLQTIEPAPGKSEMPKNPWQNCFASLLFSSKFHGFRPIRLCDFLEAKVPKCSEVNGLRSFFGADRIPQHGQHSMALVSLVSLVLVHPVERTAASIREDRPMNCSCASFRSCRKLLTLSWVS